MNAEERALLARFGYIPDPADVARVDRRHEEAVKRANPTAEPEPPAEPVVISGWETGTGHTVAHRFRADNRRSLCGWTDANPFRRCQPAAHDARCSRCEAMVVRQQVAA